MLNRCTLLFCLFIGSAACAAEDIMPLVPGADWQGGVSTESSPQLRKNMVKITLPSLAARAGHDGMALEARDLGFTDIPGLMQPEYLAREPYAAPAPLESRRHHVPEEMRFPMEPPLGAPVDRSIASNQAFNDMLNDLVSFDDEPAVRPVTAGAPAPLFIPAAPAATGERPSPSAMLLPMPSEILRNDSVVDQAVPVSAYSVHDASVIAVPELPAPVAVAPAEFGATAQRTRRAPSGARPAPEEYAPMRNLRNAIGGARHY